MTAVARLRLPAWRTLPFLALLLLAGCKTELYTGLQQMEANEMVAILLQRSIGAEKTHNKDGLDAVLVERSQFAEAVGVLREHGFPRKRFENIGDVFKASGMVSSPLQDRARFLYALSQELSATVSEIDGVLSARVEVVLPNNDIMQRNPTPSSASVFVRYDQASNIAELVPQIKMLVANSVEDLAYNKVSVVLVPVASPSTAAVAPLPAAEPWPVSWLAVGGVVLAAFGAALTALLPRLLAWFDRRRLSRPGTRPLLSIEPAE